MEVLGLLLVSVFGVVIYVSGRGKIVSVRKCKAREKKNQELREKLRQDAEAVERKHFTKEEYESIEQEFRAEISANIVAPILATIFGGFVIIALAKVYSPVMVILFVLILVVAWIFYFREKKKKEQIFTQDETYFTRKKAYVLDVYSVKRHINEHQTLILDYAKVAFLDDTGNQVTFDKVKIRANIYAPLKKAECCEIIFYKNEFVKIWEAPLLK